MTNTANKCTRRDALKHIISGAAISGTLTLGRPKLQAQGIEWQPEYAQAAIRLIYRQVLERQVDDSGLATYTNLMLNSNWSTQEVVYDIGSSREYGSRFVAPWVPGQQWHAPIAKMYQHFLNRAPENEEVVRRHSNTLVDKGFEALVRDFVYSTEYLQKWGNLGVPGYGPVPVKAAPGKQGPAPEPGQMYYFLLRSRKKSLLPCLTYAVYAISEAAARQIAEAAWPGYTAERIDAADYGRYGLCGG